MTDRSTKQANLDKQALFDLLLKKKGIVAPDTAKIPSSANGGPLPLSFPQERIWSLYQLDPESPAYHMRVARKIMGRLDKAILSQTLETIAHRHNILRSAFPEFEGQPNQLLTPNFTFPLTVLDLQGQSAEKIMLATTRHMNTFIQESFNLEKGPLVKALLLQQSPEQHILLVVFHQIIFDGVSGSIFMHELTTLYEALSVGKTAELPEITIQYADYTLWLQKQHQQIKLAAQRDYWLEQFHTEYQPLSLPTDRPRPARESFSGGLMPFFLTAQLTELLKEFSRQEKTTLFATLLAGFNALLALYGPQEDVLIFTSAEGRTHPQLKPLIGLFSRQLPLRTDLSGQPSFRTLVSRVNEVIKYAFANQDVPFAELVEMIQLSPGYSPAALFQAMFIFLSEPRSNLELSGLQIEPIPTENQLAKFDWRLHMLDQGDALLGWLEYKTDLFTESTINQVTTHFQQLLTEAMQNPDLALDDLFKLVDSDIGGINTADPQAPVRQMYVAPRDRAELTLSKIWEESFNLAPIGIHDDFFELGGHSLLAVRLFALIEEQTGRKLPLTALFKAPTIAQLAELIRDDNWEKYQTSLIPIKPDGNRLPYFFVPPAGTTVLQYATMVGLLNKEQPFYGLQPLGLEADEKPHLTVEEMAAYYLRDIQAFQPHGPYLLGGQCFGGLVAFEMARQLQAQGQTVALLAIIDTEMPPLKPSTIYNNGHHHPSIAKNAGKIINVPWQTYVFFRKTYKRTLATRMWAHKNPIYVWQNMAIWRRYSRTLQAHLDARLNYVATQPYPGKISLLQFSTSNHEPKVGRWEWSALADGGIDIQTIAADSATRQEGIFTQQLGQWLKKHLEQAQNTLTTPNE